MKNKFDLFRKIATSIVFLIIVFGLLICSIVFKDQLFSTSERRALSQFPTFDFDNVVDGKFTSSFENYTLDQFPFRDGFRKIKSVFTLDLLRQKSCNDYYMVDGYISKMEYPANDKDFDHALALFDSIYQKHLKDSNCKTYLSLIPDKNYFIAEKNGYLALDYDSVEKKFCDGMPYAEYIDMFDTLSIEDYYKTDQHWKQENIQKVAELLKESLGCTTKTQYQTVTLDKQFFGTYYGQSAFNTKPDVMSYLTNTEIENCIVTSYDTGKAKKTTMYTLDKAEGNDMYDVFLGGPDALITIDNPSAETDRELVVFRDSFASSLMPLMISDYSKITMIDLRYIQSGMIGNFVDFDNQDVLFLYSTLILNTASILK